MDGPQWAAPIDASAHGAYDKEQQQLAQAQAQAQAHLDAQLSFTPTLSAGPPRQDSANSSQQSLATRLSPDPFAAAAASSDATSAALLQQSLQRLYGSIGHLNPGSRVSLPDILEEHEADAAALASAAQLGPQGGLGGLHPSGNRSMSDEDLFGMDMAAPAAGGGGAHAPAAPLGHQRPPFGAAAQAPMEGPESRTLFVRGVDPAVSDHELQEFFEVRAPPVARSLRTTPG